MIEPLFFIPDAEMVRILQSIKLLALAVGILGGLLFACAVSSIMSMRGDMPLSMVIFGILLFIVGAAGNGAVNYGIEQVDAHRPVTIESAHEYTTSVYQPIASLKDNSFTSDIRGRGSFILGIGSIRIDGGGTVPTYVFYKIMPGGEYIQDSLPSSNVYIKEDGNKSPQVEWIYLHKVSMKKTYLDNGEVIGGDEISGNLAKTIIHVPEGTITREYNLNSEL